MSIQCGKSLLRFLIGMAMCILVVHCAHPSLEQPTEQDDLIKIHESSKPVKCSGFKQSEIVAESKIVGIYFDKNPNLRYGANVHQTVSHQPNKVKQSQDFEIDNNTTKPNITAENQTDAPQTNATNVQSTTLKPEAGLEETSATTTSTTTKAPTTVAVETTTAELVDTAVASKTIRQGDAVFCGEANPNGKSNKKLVMDRIVGGRKSEPGEFPFQVRLNIRSRRGSGICGGVILDERHILTAAHCMTACVSQHLTTTTIENSGVFATIGDHSIRSNDGELEVDIEKIIPHEKYDACNFYANDHDIALIKTSSPIEYRFTSDGYGSVNRPCMPNNTNLSYKDAEPMIVSGWGVTRENSGSLSNILRYVQVPMVPIPRCQETYGSRVTNDHICAGYQSGGKDSCQGDSGGPLVRVVDNRYELTGIVSFGYGCGQPGAPGVYTRVASYVDWIRNNIREVEVSNSSVPSS